VRRWIAHFRANVADDHCGRTSRARRLLREVQIAMSMLLSTMSVGVTLKFVIEGDDRLAQALLEALPGDITIGGVDLSSVCIGLRGCEAEPVRVAVRCEDVSFQEEDVFLENG
jgi:hypothetical protein